MADLKKWYSEHGICYICGQNEAVKGKKLCASCAATQSEKAAEYYEKHREELKAKMKSRGTERYKARKARGECVSCGKPVKPGKVRCPWCLEKNKRSQMRISRARGAMPKYMFGNGYYCETCGKPVENVKLCPECYAKAVKNIAYARTHIKSGWQSENFIFGKKAGG